MFFFLKFQLRKIWKMPNQGNRICDFVTPAAASSLVALCPAGNCQSSTKLEKGQKGKHLGVYARDRTFAPYMVLYSGCLRKLTVPVSSKSGSKQQKRKHIRAEKNISIAEHKVNLNSTQECLLKYISFSVLRRKWKKINWNWNTGTRQWNVSAN